VTRLVRATGCRAHLLRHTNSCPGRTNRFEQQSFGREGADTGIGKGRLRCEIDPVELRQIAEKSGGRFYRARDRQDLEKIYAEIEKLERTKRVEKRWSETYDLYLAWLAPGLLLHVIAWALGATLLRRLP